MGVGVELGGSGPLGSHDIASPHLLGAVASLEVVLVLLLSRWDASQVS